MRKVVLGVFISLVGINGAFATTKCPGKVVEVLQWPSKCGGI